MEAKDADISLKANESYVTKSIIPMEGNATHAVTDIPLEVNECYSTNMPMKANECYGTASADGGDGLYAEIEDPKKLTSEDYDYVN